MSLHAAEVCSHVLTLLVEAQQLLEGLVEIGEIEEGSPPEVTLLYLDDAVAMLTPKDEPASPPPQTPPALRLVVNRGSSNAG